jgi:hypothetical protein
MVVSNCMPGIAADVRALGDQAASARAPDSDPSHRLVATAWSSHTPSSSTARMNSSVTRTLLLEFWKNTDEYGRAR